MRSLTASLSTENLLHNFKIIKQHASNSKIIAMVKANAYGHGLRSTSLRLQPAVDFLGVAAIDEALQLRQAGVTIPIILMEGVFEPEELVIAIKENFSVVFHSVAQINWLNNLKYNNNLINAWLKIDTGMGRLGFSLEQAIEIYKLLINNNNIAKPLGIMSHFACADNYRHYLNNTQINNFNNFIKNINHNSILSFCNSAGIFNFPKQHYDVVRPGLALYGVSPILEKSAEDLNLKPVMTLKTSIIAIKTLLKNSAVGYGAEFICPKDLKVAVIAVGYGDGYPRITKPNMPVLINGNKCNLIGRVSMDMAIVNLENCLDVKLGDSVILWGDDLPIEEIAQYTNNSVYDLLTGVQNRVRFNWSAP
jgi:alanine racemase